MARHGMTGFGRGEADAGDARVVVEAKSVNHRFLDVKVSLPRRLTSLEASVVAAVKAKVGRGRVEIGARVIRADDAESPGVSADLDAARGVLAVLHDVQNALGVPGDVTVSDMARWVDRFSVRAEGPDVEALADPLAQAVGAALEGLVSARAEEGASLKADLLGQGDVLAAAVAKVAERAPELVEEGRRRLRERVSRLLEGTSAKLDEGRLEQEIAILADRSDVHEELQRLRHHLQDLQMRLDEPSDEPMGRRIDFLAQEIGREVNTLGSKISDPAVSSTVVEMKAAVERVREQVQNLE